MSWTLSAGLPAQMSTNLGLPLSFFYGSLLHAFCGPELWDTALFSGLSNLMTSETGRAI